MSRLESTLNSLIARQQGISSEQVSISYIRAERQKDPFLDNPLWIERAVEALRAEQFFASFAQVAR